MGNYIDKHVGSKLKLARVAKGLSQTKLGSLIGGGEEGVSFQQIQKYEKGTNRIAASRLFEFSNVLSININYFFEGLERGNIEKSDSLDKRLVKLYRAFNKLSGISREAVLKVTQLLAGEKEDV